MNNAVLARRYAYAFYNIFPRACTLEKSDLLHHINHFFMEHRKMIFFLALPQLNVKNKKKAIQIIVHTIGLPEEYSTLYMLLIQHKRTFLITDVGVQLRHIILEKNNNLRQLFFFAFLLQLYVIILRLSKADQYGQAS